MSSAHRLDHKKLGIRTLSEVERETILDALELLGGSRKQTAKALGMGYRTLTMKLAQYKTEGHLVTPYLRPSDN